ncbi:CYSTEINE PROTEINASE SUPERFAMILY PROTEIN [Salix koriyanagi]|uniref:CYSTEINE PROTEINASE SUPERFAMILY PROTEIN n=1 Tax=Salix koriyanagi TaxID=2511006 RepID=A0A9Q0WIU1_9ROSI|nr:CYSTEINE PROTEINASE SUPERFAMILY PROTEIN [Salix koriyanagi]
MIVENDAVIARALQEELSRDAAAEGSGLNNTEYVREHYNDPLHASNVENDAVIARALQEELSSESALDGEVGNRIAEMVLFPHAPKTNGEIPSEDEQMSDHQRLLERLKSCDCVEKKVQGDGNCQFRSLSDQLYRSPEHHQVVRELVVKQLESEPERYNGYVPMAYGDYLKKMNKSGEWGDHVTLQAAADSVWANTLPCRFLLLIFMLPITFSGMYQ